MRRIGFGKMLVFAALPALLLAACAEVGARVWLWSQDLLLYRQSAIWQLSRGIWTRPATGGLTVFFKPLAERDPLLGYKCRPGRHEILIDRGDSQLRFTATIGEDGFRITSRGLPGGSEGQVWLLGCSFTWGLGVSDEQTFAWILQQELPQYRIRNLSCNGYGTTHAYLLLNASRQENQPKPKVAVVVYNSFHLERNIVSPSYLQSLNSAGEAFGRSRAFFPQARLEAGMLKIVPVALFQPVDPANLPSGSAIETTIALFRAIEVSAKEVGTRLIIAFQSGPGDDPVIEFARKEGMEVADIRIDLAARHGARYQNLPFDSHPNAAAHRAYAAALYPSIVSSRKVSDGRQTTTTRSVSP